MTAEPPGRNFVRLAWVVLGVAALCGAAELIAGPGYRLSWWSLGVGIQIVRWGATIALGAAALGLVATFMTARRGPRKVAVASVLLALVVAAPPLLLFQRVQTLPKIHDISTDTDHPPSFVAIRSLRQGARNPLEYSAATAAQQKRGYPDLVPLMTTLPPTAALARAERTARELGWEVVDVSAPDLRLEATDTSLLFGFKDDVVIRVTPLAEGSRIDLRSLSRVGGSDFGVNAKRIRKFVDRFAAAA